MKTRGLFLLFAILLIIPATSPAQVGGLLKNKMNKVVNAGVKTLDKEVDNQIDTAVNKEAEKARVKADQRAEQKRVQKLFAEQLPMIPLVVRNFASGAKTNLGNYRPSVIIPRSLWNADELFWRK